jgi:hypothetical protein
MTSKPTVPPTRHPIERAPALVSEELDRVRDALRDLHYGTVTVVVHDGAVVQIDRTEKIRLGRSANGA